MSQLAPIILFAYNRPELTLQTLESLSKNAEAAESHLFVFSDGAKETATAAQVANIQKVRDLVLSQKWCKKVTLHCNEKNKGLANSVIGLKKIMALAEKLKITVCMELLNSKIDHKDYQCDNSNWGSALVKSVGSDNFKLLYDIYHMQIMEGDIIRNIRDNQAYIGHYHTGGVPGRNEIDDSQELYYPAIMKAIAETGYKGFVAQEFIPKNVDKLASLDKCVKICNI